MFIEKPATKQSLSGRRPVYGIGINDADYITIYKSNSYTFTCPFYRRWKNMLSRCCDKKYLERHKTYKDCSVCKEWLTFSNFRAWMIKQDWRGNHLDKDIISQGNKVYSPNSCLFVTNEVNALFIDSKTHRGDYPRGVCKRNGCDYFISQCRVNNKVVFLGNFVNAELASEAYKKFKYKVIKSIAEKQSEPLRSCMLAYKV